MLAVPPVEAVKVEVHVAVAVVPDNVQVVNEPVPDEFLDILRKADSRKPGAD